MKIAIPQDDPVRLASAQLEKLDYRKLYHAYSPQGRKSAAEPRIIFEGLGYGYMCGIYSTRKLEEACRKRVDFMWLLQGEPVPDYSTFARFRTGRTREAVEDLPVPASLLQSKRQQTERTESENGFASAQRTFTAKNRNQTRSSASHQPFHLSGGRFWRTEKRPQLQLLSYSWPGQHFHRTLSSVPWIQFEQTMGEMQHR